MTLAPSLIPNFGRLIPYEPSNLYKSLEYCIKKALGRKTRMTFQELTVLMNNDKSLAVLGNFKCSRSVLVEKRIRKVLSCLCLEKKVVKKNNYFQNSIKNKQKVVKIVNQIHKIKKFVF